MPLTSPSLFTPFLTGTSGGAPVTVPGGIGIPAPLPVQRYWSVVHYTHDEYALGDVYPNNLDFAVYLNRVGYCNYDIDFSHPLAKKENVSPYETDFILYRGDRSIIGGEHTSIGIQEIEPGVLNVAGMDWWHYFERQQWDFDPDNPTANLYLVTDRDVALIVKDLLTATIARPNSLEVDLSQLVAIGQLMDYKIEVNDTGDIYTKVVDLAKRFPGFDFEITPERVAKIYYPQRGAINSTVLTQGHNIYGVSYTNNGPVATHTLGTAQTSSSRAGYIVNSVAPQFRRADAQMEFQDITGVTELQAATIGEAARNVSPHRELTLKIIPETLDVWEEVALGDTIWVEADTSYEVIDEDFRVVGMQCSPNDEGDEEWSLTLDDGTLSL